MRAYELGPMNGLDSWRLVDRPTPTPGYGQVLIRVHAVSLNYRDAVIAGGHYPFPAPTSQMIPVSDGAGEVLAVGEGVRGWKTGDRVAGIFAQSWQGGVQPDDAWVTTLGGAVDGMLAEEVVLDQAGLVRVPDCLSWEEAATLPCAAVTAWNALNGLTTLKAGETVLCLGTGGVSIFAAQLAAASGARVIVTSSSDAKLARAKALGAHDLVNYRTTPEWQDEVRRITGGRGVDRVIEVGGASTIAKSVASVRPGGVIALMGLLAEGQPIDPGAILIAGAIVRGIMVGSREMFEEMNQAIELHSIKPAIDRVYTFDEAKTALGDLVKGEHVGKLVIKLR
jgi:NADPH:quinone reductase-like Zn-dependent oxidoreductase